MIESIDIIINDLYNVFKSYPRNCNMVGSIMYRGEIANWNKDLCSVPLRALGAADLSGYCAKAITTWGNLADFKFYLPRILELVADIDPPYEVWVIFNKMMVNDSTSWKKSERQIIRRYMLALWATLLQNKSDKASTNFSDYFAALAKFYSPFCDLVQVWDNDNSASSTTHLAKYVFENQEDLFKKRRIPGLYNAADNIEELLEWILSSDVIERLNPGVIDSLTPTDDSDRWEKYISYHLLLQHAG